jgi:NO-binding membrane sensor protein with MHYT domain
MPVVYDPTLIVLSVFVAIIGSLASLTVTASHGGAGAGTLILGALVAGATVWAMHFIAMLAAKLPVEISYAPVEAGLSLGAAILFAGIGLNVARVKGLNPVKIPLAAAVMGSGMSAANYLGMDAVRGAGVAFSFEWVAASVAVAIAGAGAGLWLASRKRGAVGTLLGGTVLGLAIAGMHYTGMHAANFYPSTAVADDSIAPVSQWGLTLAAGTATAAICGYYLFLFSSMLTGEKA